VDFTKQSPVGLSFCAGLRGLERAVERVLPGLRTCAYVEIEAFIIENLLAAMEAGLVAPAPIWPNLKTFNPEPFRGRVDIILGGYPCQPFSYAGHRAGVEDPRHLWPHLFRIVEAIRPVQCFFENVAGHPTLGYAQVYRSLRDLGYRVESGLYTASEVGAPHERERLFILAILGNAASFNEWDERLCAAGSEIIDRKSGSPVAHTDGAGLRRDDKGRFLAKTVRAGPELTDTDDLARRVSDLAGRDQSPEAQRSGTELADTDHDGQNRPKERGSPREGSNRSAARTQKFFESQRLRSVGPDDRFPAGQGKFQFQWEEPRTIESRMVYTVDGYDFAEDLHRAIGNSVVEQTGEIAYIDLMHKHGLPWTVQSSTP
jgi:site-specific DNA-cytosine methylase